MVTFTLNDQFLTKEEQGLFRNHVHALGLDENIWEVFASLFRSVTKHTRPLLLRAMDEKGLAGAAIIVKCSHYGKTLFSNNLPATMMDAVRVPFYQWIRFGCCMDMMSNPGFVRDPVHHDEMVLKMAEFLKKRNLLTIINDYSTNERLYPSAALLPALPHASIDCTSLSSVEDYTSNFKNINKKLKIFHRKGGEYSMVPDHLKESQIEALKKCFLATAEKSVFYLPYQDLYLSSAINTSQTPIPESHYFVATMDGEFLGYQAALKTGRHLNALHGAFDRTRKTNYHAYDILFVKMTEFAIEHGLEDIDFGAVLNYTKQKMVNKTREMSYFIYSKYPMVQKAMRQFLKSTKIQGKEQLKFLD